MEHRLGMGYVLGGWGNTWLCSLAVILCGILSFPWGGGLKARSHLGLEG